MTNREWLESLNDEDLADFIGGVCICSDGGCHCCDLGLYCDRVHPTRAAKDWLKAKRSENE